MLRHGKTTIEQHITAVAQRMHEQILTQTKTANLVPRKNPVLGQHGRVINCVIAVILGVLINIIAYDEINADVIVDKRAQARKQGLERAGIEPVVGIDHLIIHAICLGKAFENRHTVPAIFLVNGLYEIGVLLLPRARNLERVVLRRSVIYDDDLHILGKIGAFEDRRNAVVHIFS